MIGTMEILAPEGHLTLTWDPDQPDEVAAARAEWERLKEAGYTFFSVEPAPAEDLEAGKGHLLVRMDEAPAEPAKPRRGRPRKAPEGPRRAFEPRSERTVATPPLRGG